MKFSIRDLSWLTVVVALAMGWWVERLKGSAAVERVHELEQGYMGLKPGSYRIVPMNEPETPTHRQIRIVTVEHKNLPNSKAPAPNPAKK